MCRYWHLSAGKMKVFSLGLLILSVLAVNAHAQFLGSASSFGVLGEAGVTNTGSSMIYGSVAGSTGTPAVTGFPPGTVVAPGVLYTTGVMNAGPGTPFGDATSAFNTLAGLTPVGPTLNSNLTGQTVGVGVYQLGAASLDGVLTLDFGNSATLNQNIVFQIASSLITGSADGASVVIENANSTDNVFWQVVSNVQIGTYTSFVGNIIASAGVAMQTGATDLCGSVISLNASVTLDTNTISTTCAGGTGTGGGGTVIGGGTGGGPGVTVPEGGSTLLYLCSFLLP